MARFFSDRVEPKGKTSREEFLALSDWINRDTQHSSRTIDSISHPGFSEILKLDDALLFLAEVLYSDFQCSWWIFNALHRLGVHPEISDKDRGCYDKIRTAFRSKIADPHTNIKEDNGT
jgi:hypothetical protein